MPEPEYLSKDQFEEYRSSVADKLRELNDRETRNFKLIFAKLEEIKNSQVVQTEHIKTLGDKIQVSVTQDNFNELFDDRLVTKKLLNEDKLKLNYVQNDESWQDWKRISWAFGGIWKWVLGSGAVITAIITILELLVKAVS